MIPVMVLFLMLLKTSIISGITHEDLSLLLMRKLNENIMGRLDLAIEIFTGNYTQKIFS